MPPTRRPKRRWHHLSVYYYAIYCTKHLFGMQYLVDILSRFKEDKTMCDSSAMIVMGIVSLVLILCIVKIYQATQSIDKKMDQIIELLENKKS